MELLRSQLERRKLQADQQRRAISTLGNYWVKAEEFHSDENLQSLNDLVKRLKQEGKTMILLSH